MATAKAAVLLGVALAIGWGNDAAAQGRAPGVAAGAIAFRNDLPGSFRLERVRFWIDGALRYEGPRPFDAALPPGEHVVSVSAEYRLHDPVLPYVSGYRVVLHSADRVVASPGAPALVARAVEDGGVTTSIERRARIVWR